MVVNPFWFGVLMTVVVEIMLVILSAAIAMGKETVRRKQEEDKDGEGH